MLLRVLGSAAGGGFPQWNCDCPCCQAVRDGTRPASPRTQSSVAVSADGESWYLLNVSPDIHAQIEAFPALRPGKERTIPVAGVLLTDAELDHTLGVLLLREAAGGLTVHGTDATRDTMQDGTGILRTLRAYCPVDWRPVVPGASVPLAGGLSYRAFDVPTTKKPRFAAAGAGLIGDRARGRVVGYRITDAATGGAVVFLPGVQDLTPEIMEQLDGCACLLVDGTCWSDDEMIGLGLAAKTARDMGHVPISGPGGSLERLAPPRPSRAPVIGRVIYTHINNTNPILLDDSPERHAVGARGVEVAADGLELEI